MKRSPARLPWRDLPGRDRGEAAVLAGEAGIMCFTSERDGKEKDE